MKAFNRTLIGSLVGLSLVGSMGCRPQNLPAEAEPKIVDIYAPYGGHTDSTSGVGVALGDVNSDGLSDLIVGSPSSVKYFRNLGAGRFREEQTICSPYGGHTDSTSGVGVALGDIDNDGDLDVIVGSPSSVRAYLNVEGHFSPQVN